MANLSGSVHTNGRASGIGPSSGGTSSAVVGSSNTNGALSSGAQSSDATSDPFFRQLDGAASVVRQYLQEDVSHPDLSEHLSATTPGHYRLVLNEISAPVERKRNITIPDAVLEAITSSNAYAGQGLFPEIERAWITIDNNLFLWDYLDGRNDAIEYHRHSDIIQSVGLVRARKDVLIDTVKHVLVLSTTSSVTLLGLALESPKPPSGPSAGATTSRKELKIYGLDMVVPTQGVTMVDFCSTDSGRLFCRGREDDCIYEISYQAQESWFKQKCTLTNLTAPTLSNLVPSFLQSKQREALTTVIVDRERSVLYALYKRTEIEVWNIPADHNKQPHKVARATDICRQATNICPSTNMLPSFDFTIEWLGAVSPSESKTLHMVAVTSKGVRLYFSHSRSFYRTSSGAAPPVDCLDLRAVRPPPQPNSVEDPEERALRAQSSNTAADIPPQHPATGNIRTAYYSHGVFLAASTLTKDHDSGTDNILYIARSPARASRAGTSTTLGLPQNVGTASELAETATDLIPRTTTTVISEAPQSASVPIVDANGMRLSLFGLQLVLPPRQFIVLGPSGVVILSERRPIDVLRGMLEANQAYEQTIVPLFSRYGHPQCCAMLLAIAARNRHATQSIALEGGAMASNGVDSSTISDDAVSNAWRLFFEFGGAPSSLAGLRTTQALSETNVRVSNRFEGLALYLARLLRPFWTSAVTKTAPVPGNPNRQDAAVSAAVLTSAQADLTSLAQFLQANAQFFVLNAQNQRNFGTQEGEAYAWKVEHDRVEAIRALISRTLEALSFVLLLIDYQLPAVVSVLKPERQKQLASLLFVDLITTSQGRDVARALVEAVIDRQIASQVSIDSIADVLQQRCGSFCSAADVQLYKALELVRGAKEARDPVERAACLKDSLKLLYKATPHLPFEKLQAICADFRELKHARGAIELPLKCAAAWDPSNVADSISPNASTTLLQNHPALPILEKRNACYALVLEMLQDVDDALDKAEQLPESATDRLSELRKASDMRQDAYALALEQSDKLFHWKLYDWLLERGLTEQLVQVQSPFIEDYLLQEPNSVEKLHLLWQLYRRDERYPSAALVLRGLAKVTEVDTVRLVDRIEYLSMGLNLAKSSHEPVSDIVHDIEDQLDVARVQLEVQQWLRQKRPDDERIYALDEDLLDMTALWNEYALPYEMNEVKIMIFHISAYRDTELVQATWSELIEEAHSDPHFQEGQHFQAVHLKVVEIARRFMPSDTACPVPVLQAILEKYAYNERNTQDISVGWAPMTLLQAGGNAREIFDSLDAMLNSRVEPWDTKQARVFLLSEMSSYLTNWLHDALTHSRPGAGAGLDFPASRVDDAISAYLAVASSLSSAVAKGEVDLPVERSLGRITTELKGVQEHIRLKF
ncbi:hypothetical protein A4X13_0g1693 [Tilletia indica]|uniref:Nucleoporin Nup133/Nup155-like N-terminal domain-containing protein n=1 Tax=Tilletia indica TaxID=43049 RepID=A0A177TVK4_9BASI|nr:hypothetical protein A4X13_0g1693 [Tilletia indica]